MDLIPRILKEKKICKTNKMFQNDYMGCEECDISCLRETDKNECNGQQQAFIISGK
jgi:hypothetical protein